MKLYRIAYTHNTEPKTARIEAQSTSAAISKLKAKYIVSDVLSVACIETEVQLFKG